MKRPLKEHNKPPEKRLKEEDDFKETIETGLNEDPEMRKIHDANLDDSFDRAESELDD